MRNLRQICKLKQKLIRNVHSIQLVLLLINKVYATSRNIKNGKLYN